MPDFTPLTEYTGIDNAVASVTIVLQIGPGATAFFIPHLARAANHRDHWILTPLQARM